MIQKETYELLEPLINALPTTIYITNVVDNNDGTFTIYTNSTLHLQASNRVLTIDGNDYVVTEVVNNTSIKVTGTEPIIVDNFEIYPVKFWHGTQIRTNIELKDISPLSEDKFPCVWLYEVLREQNNYDETSSIGRTVDLRLYFLTETDFINKDNEQRYTDAVKPMRNAYHYFLEVLEQAGAVVGEIEEAETTPYPIFGRESEAGIVANIFNHNLGGLGVRITIPFKNSYCCCDDLNNFVADFINNNINTAKQLICQTLPECGTIINLDERVTALEDAPAGSSVWGGITGTLSNQTDLQTALDGKVNTEVGKGLSTNDLTNGLKSNYDNAYSHISLTNNPHSVTKTQVGLGNVPDIDTSNPANITQSASYRFVSDTEKSTWNGKNEQILQAQLNTNSTTTGSTNETVVSNLAVLGSVNTVNSKLEIIYQLVRSGTNAAATHRFYISSVGTNTIGTTGVPASSTLIGTYSHPATSLISSFDRRMTNKNSLSLNEVFPASVSSLTDRATSTSAYTAVNFNTANNYWIVHTVQLANSADIVGSNNTQINIIK